MPPKGTTAISRPVVRFKWVSREFENSDSHLDVHNRKYRFVCIKCGDVLSNFTKGSSVRTLFPKNKYHHWNSCNMRLVGGLTPENVADRDSICEAELEHAQKYIRYEQQQQQQPSSNAPPSVSPPTASTSLTMRRSHSGPGMRVSPPSSSLSSQGLTSANAPTPAHTSNKPPPTVRRFKRAAFPEAGVPQVPTQVSEQQPNKEPSLEEQLDKVDVRCRCDRPFVKQGTLFQCSTCLHWAHARCFAIADEENIFHDFKCHLCTGASRPLESTSSHTRSARHRNIEDSATSLNTLEELPTAKAAGSRRKGVPVRGPEPQPGFSLNERAAGPDDIAGVRLHLESPQNLMSMTEDWTDEEKASRRRLIECTRTNDGADVYASFHVSSQADYAQEKVMVSCIAMDASFTKFCITSTDVILLLESLVLVRLHEADRKRLRLALNAFPFMTLTKSSPSTSEMHQTIVNYRDPMARNSDQALKVFHWNSLQEALHVILAKWFHVAPEPSSLETPVKAEDDASAVVPLKAPEDFGPLNLRYAQGHEPTNASGRPVRKRKPPPTQNASPIPAKKRNSRGQTILDIDSSDGSDLSDESQPARRRKKAKDDSLSDVSSSAEQESDSHDEDEIPSAIAANAVSLATFLNHSLPGLGSVAAPMLEDLGITHHAQFARFRKVEWFEDFFDQEIMGKGLSTTDETMLRRIICDLLTPQTA